MTLRSTLKKNTPTGTTRARGFGDWHDEKGRPQGGIVEVDLETFSEADIEQGERLRATRKRHGLLLGDVARLTGLSTSEVSGLEFGKYSIDVDAYEDALSKGRTP